MGRGLYQLPLRTVAMARRKDVAFHVRAEACACATSGAGVDSRNRNLLTWAELLTDISHVSYLLSPGIAGKSITTSPFSGIR